MSNRVKISEIAKEAGKNWREVISKAQELGIETVDNQLVSVEDAGKIFEGLRNNIKSFNTNNNNNREYKTYRTRNDDRTPQDSTSTLPNGERPVRQERFNRDDNRGYRSDRPQLDPTSTLPNGERPVRQERFNRDDNRGYRSDRTAQDPTSTLPNGERPVRQERFNRDDNRGYRSDRPQLDPTSTLPNGERPVRQERFNRDDNRGYRSDRTAQDSTSTLPNGERPVRQERFNRDDNRGYRSDRTAQDPTSTLPNGERPVRQERFNRDDNRGYRSDRPQLDPTSTLPNGERPVRQERFNRDDRNQNRFRDDRKTTIQQNSDQPTYAPVKSVLYVKSQATSTVSVNNDPANSQQLASDGGPKGLRIIKKRRSSLISKDDSLENIVYGKLSESARQELNQKRALAKKTSTVSSSSNNKKKNSGAELNIFERDFDHSNKYEDDHEHEIVLLDYRDPSLFADESIDKKDVDLEAKKDKLKKIASANKAPKKSRNQQELVKETRKKRKRVKVEEENVTNVEVPENIRVYEFAEMIKKPLGDVIKSLFTLGVMVTKNDFLDGETIEILAEEYGIEVVTVDMTDEFNYVRDYDDIEENQEEFVIRAPVITIMGHVDHGKTSLLDKIRSSKVALGEAGGITQHIGAYTIQHEGNPITFIDTPGHSAFSEMRKRGARITDIVVIVVAGDDGVKPQTREAIKHAQDAGVPIIVAMNKMDKEGANADMVRAQVAETGLTPVEWGGETEFIPVSAKTGDGIDTLLETILIQAEVLELSANPNRNAKAVVIESTLEKGRGPVATVIVHNGTLKIGDSVVVGEHYGKVKALLDYNKKAISQIAPGETGVVVGLSGIPASGEDLVVTDTETEARELADKRRIYERNVALSKTTKASLDELSSMIAEGKLKVLKIILKTDVHGTLEAIKHSLEALKNEEVKVSIISEGVGGITENDVVMASDSENIMIIGFNVRPTGVVKSLAEKNNVKLKTYTIIYEILDDVTNILTGMMKPIEEEKHTGQAEIRQIFKVRDGVVAGCVVVDGAIQKGILARVIRNGVVLGNTNVESLKRFKDEVMEVKRGFECGILLKNFDNIAEGDVIETYEKVTRQAKF